MWLLLFRLLGFLWAWRVYHKKTNVIEGAKNEKFLNFEVIKGEFESDKKTHYLYVTRLNSSISVSFKEEIWLEKLFKSVKLLSEQTIGLADFDDHIFIVSDDREVKELLMASEYKLANMILHFFKKCPQANLNIKENMMTLDTLVTLDEEEISMFEDLRILIDQKMGKRESPSFKEKYSKILALEFVFNLIFAQGMVGIFDIYNHLFGYIDLHNLFIFSFILYLFFVVLSGILIRVFLQNSSLISYLLFEFLLYVFVFYPIAAISIVSDMNIYLDQSKAVDSEYILKNKHKSRRGHYYMYVAKPEAQDDESQITVPYQLWKNTPLETELIIWEKNGFFHIPYVHHVEVKNK